MSKTALITGANKGIGLEICRQLAQQDYTVFLTARNEDRGLQAQQTLQSQGLDVRFVQMDVGDANSIQQAYQTVQQQTSVLDVLVNNAAILIDKENSMLEMEETNIRATLDINAIGLWMVTRTFLPLLTTGSRIVNISSGAGSICGGMGSYAPVYSISKATVNAITLQFSNSLHARGIQVNAVCPGWVRTDMGGSGASRSVEKGAETPVWMATDPQFNHSGMFFRDKQIINW